MAEREPGHREVDEVLQVAAWVDGEGGEVVDRVVALTFAVAGPHVCRTFQYFNICGAGRLQARPLLEPVEAEAVVETFRCKIRHGHLRLLIIDVHCIKCSRARGRKHREPRRQHEWEQDSPSSPRVAGSCPTPATGSPPRRRRFSALCGSGSGSAAQQAQSFRVHVCRRNIRNIRNIRNTRLSPCYCIFSWQFKTLQQCWVFACEISMASPPFQNAHERSCKPHALRTSDSSEALKSRTAEASTPSSSFLKLYHLGSI